MATEELPNTVTGPGAPEAYFDHEGTPLAYIDQGTGPVTVVAVPGLPGSTREFRWLVAELIPRSRVIRVDPPGFGCSARPRLIGMTIAQRTEPVETLITALDLAPVVLLGHSAGLTVATFDWVLFEDGDTVVPEPAALGMLALGIVLNRRGLRRG